MEMYSCPSCKKKILGNTKKCPDCGFLISAKTSFKTKDAKAISLTVALIIILAAGFVLFSVSLSDKPIEENQPLSFQAETIKNIDGAEFTPGDILDKFNSFMKETGADSLIIEELILESGESENIYRDIKNNESISISMATSRTSAAVTSVSVLAKRPAEFIKYCFSLMSIFTPTMKADIRQKVLFSMMEYEESADIPLREENTYIIVDTKYTFAYSEQKGLSMLIEQMPKLELYSGDLPVIR
jgi:hypothetical protein